MAGLLLKTILEIIKDAGRVQFLPMKILNRDCVDFLVVDDDPLVTRFLSDYLQEKGHTCATLTKSFQTAAWLELHDCEVVVVDLNMPKVDGISLITYIREIQPSLPVIVFTGIGYEEERMHADLRAGANGYVSKHLPIEQLYCVLSRMLATSRQRPGREARRPARSALLGAAKRGRATRKRSRRPSGETVSAPLAPAVSCSRKSPVATMRRNRPAYLLANRSMIESAVWPARE